MSESDTTPLKVMLVDDDPDRAATVEASLQENGFEVSSVLPTASGILFQIERQRPDVIVIDLQSSDRDVLESLSIISHHNPTPIVMFSEEDDPGYIKQAVDAGVTAYLVDGIRADKVKPIIDVAIAQFESFQTLRQALTDSQTELTDRKIIERAKGLLMETRNLSESDSFALLRKLAMDNNQKLAEVAQTIITTLSAGPTSTNKKSGKSKEIG